MHVQLCNHITIPIDSHIYLHCTYMNMLNITCSKRRVSMCAIIPGCSSAHLCYLKASSSVLPDLVAHTQAKSGLTSAGGFGHD
jgi:hypothetical protein